MYKSVRGRELAYTENYVLLHGRPVGGALIGRGKTFYVDSGVNRSSGVNPDEAMGTLAAAITACTANRGDRIVVMPNHEETITGAGGITASKAGIEIIGLGTYGQVPRFLMDASTAVTVNVSAADVVFRNLNFVSGHDGVVTCFNITAKGCVLDGIVFGDNTTDEHFLTPIKATSTTDNNADGLTVVNCRWASIDVGSLEFIEVNADLRDLVVRDNFVVHEGTASPLILFATGKDMQFGDVRDNFLSHKMTANEVLVNIDTSANSGIIAHNRVGHADVTTTHDLGIDGLGCRLFDNLSTSTDSLSGVVLPAADVNS